MTQAAIPLRRKGILSGFSVEISMLGDKKDEIKGCQFRHRSNNVWVSRQGNEMTFYIKSEVEI